MTDKISTIDEKTPKEFKVPKPIEPKFQDDPNVQEHTHDGINSDVLSADQINRIPVVSTVPSDPATEGTMYAYDDESSTRTLYIMMNGTWRSVTLT